MVSTPPTPSTTSTSSAPLTQDQFNAYVQNTYGRYPLTIVRGEGCKLFDSDGKVRPYRVMLERCTHGSVSSVDMSCRVCSLIIV